MCVHACVMTRYGEFTHTWSVTPRSANGTPRSPSSLLISYYNFTCMEIKNKYVNENNPSSSSYLVHANNLCGVQAGASGPKSPLIASSTPRCFNNFWIQKISRLERGSSFGGDVTCLNTDSLTVVSVIEFGTSDRLVSETGCGELFSSETFWSGWTRVFIFVSSDRSIVYLCQFEFVCADRFVYATVKFV